METKKRSADRKGNRIGRNEEKILKILEQYPELTAKDIADIIWARDIRYQTAEYTSVHRSLRTLYKKGLVDKVGGQIMWKKTKRSH